METRRRGSGARSFARAQTALFERYGLDADSRFVDASTGRAHVFEAGSGPPIVMVDGIGTPAAMWAPLAARLDGYSIFGVDLPGFGPTESDPDLFEDYRASAVAFLSSVLDSLSLERPRFVANSLGSLWTLWFALDHPDRVSAMVHVGCPAVVLGTSAPLPMRLMSVRGLGPLLTKIRPPSPTQVEGLGRMVREDPLEPEIAQVLLETELLDGFLETFHATLHELVRLGGAREEHVLTEQDLEKVVQPCLFVWGDNDPMGSVEIGRRVARYVPRGDLHVSPGGHAPWLGHAEDVAPPVASFLRETAES